eukprot:g1705.t1
MPASGSYREGSGSSIFTRGPSKEGDSRKCTKCGRGFLTFCGSETCPQCQEDAKVETKANASEGRDKLSNNPRCGICSKRVEKAGQTNCWECENARQKFKGRAAAKKGHGKIDDPPRREGSSNLKRAPAGQETEPEQVQVHAHQPVVRAESLSPSLSPRPPRAASLSDRTASRKPRPSLDAGLRADGPSRRKCAKCQRTFLSASGKSTECPNCRGEKGGIMQCQTCNSKFRTTSGKRVCPSCRGERSKGEKKTCRKCNQRFTTYSGASRCVICRGKKADAAKARKQAKKAMEKKVKAARAAQRANTDYEALAAWAAARAREKETASTSAGDDEEVGGRERRAARILGMVVEERAVEGASSSSSSSNNTTTTTTTTTSAADDADAADGDSDGERDGERLGLSRCLGVYLQTFNREYRVNNKHVFAKPDGHVLFFSSDGSWCVSPDRADAQDSQARRAGVASVASAAPLPDMIAPGARWRTSSGSPCDISVRLATNREKAGCRAEWGDEYETDTDTDTESEASDAKGDDADGDDGGDGDGDGE